MSHQNGSVPIQIHGAPDDLVHLLAWFRRDENLRGRVKLDSPPAADGQMGDLYDVLSVTFAAGGFGTVLASSIKTWFTTRKSDVTLTVKTPDGTEISLDAKRVNQDETFAGLRSLLTLSDGDQ